MPSANNKYIPNEAVIPIVETSVFDSNPNARFAIGVLHASEIEDYAPGSLAHAYLQLRANTYIQQTGMLPETDLREDGTEIDVDDERSSHFIMMENRLGSAALFGSMRLINKHPKSPQKLPIETFFHEDFETPLQVPSTEASRFISRYPNARFNSMALFKLITTGIAFTINNNPGRLVGAVELEFEKQLSVSGLSVTEITQPKMVPKYNDVNVGIEIDKIRSAQKLGPEAMAANQIEFDKFNFWGTLKKSDSPKE